MKNRELEWEVRREERGNSWPSLEYSEFKRQWAGDINSPQPQAFTHTHRHAVELEAGRGNAHTNTQVFISDKAREHKPPSPYALRIDDESSPLSPSLVHSLSPSLASPTIIISTSIKPLLTRGVSFPLPYFTLLMLHHPFSYHGSLLIFNQTHTSLISSHICQTII